MMPARLTSSLLVRKGQARSSGGPRATSCDLDQPRPAGAEVSRPAALCGPMAEILVPARTSMPTM